MEDSRYMTLQGDGLQASEKGGSVQRPLRGGHQIHQYASVALAPPQDQVAEKPFVGVLATVGGTNGMKV